MPVSRMGMTMTPPIPNSPYTNSSAPGERSQADTDGRNVPFGLEFKVIGQPGWLERAPIDRPAVDRLPFVAPVDDRPAPNRRRVGGSNGGGYRDGS
jgi:hypothetical protein